MRLVKGYTLLEILLVITIIGVLAGALILVIDPAEQFANARNQQREIDLQTILLATEEYAKDNRGQFPNGLESTYKSICISTCLTSSTQVNLQELIPYIGTNRLPVDPDETDENLTGYRIRITADNRINITAPLAENGVAISTGSASESVVFDPRVMPGFVMWFSADEGVTTDGVAKVASWQDRSDTGFTFTQTDRDLQPSLIETGATNFKAISFDGIDDFMDGVTYDFNGNNEMSLVIVSAVTTQSGQNDPSDEFQHAYAPLFFSETGTNGELHINPQIEEVTWRFGTGVGQTLPDYARPAAIGGEYTSTIAVKNSAIERLYVNGTNVMQQSGKSFPTANIATQAQLGRENFSQPSYFQGNIVEIMAFESALSESDILNMQAYFSGKYGIF